MSVLDAYEAERVKAAVHGALGALALVCCAYNALARAHRGYGLHLTVNALAYGALAVYEVVQVSHHAARIDAGSQ